MQSYVSEHANDDEYEWWVQLFDEQNYDGSLMFVMAPMVVMLTASR